MLPALNNATIRPISRTKCASVFADSIAKHTSGSGNAFSGLVDAWNAPSPGAALKSLFLGGYNPEFPQVIRSMTGLQALLLLK